MLRRSIVALAVAGLLAGAAPAAMAAKPTSWDGLALTKSKKFDAVYLMPGADFRTYTKVMLDPTEVAFKKDWVRDYNRTTLGLSGRIQDSDVREAMTKVRAGFEEAFRKAHSEAGYEVVTAPGPDVLRVRTAVVDLYATAPDMQTAGRSRTFSEDAGAATVIIEVRDSESGALLGRAVDGRVAGDTGPFLRNSVTNRSDFLALFRDWAKISVNGLAELKARSPIAP